jgi:hypothetical protein
MHDLDVMKQIDDIAQTTGVGTRLRGEIMRKIAERDNQELRFLADNSAKRLRFLGTDGFRLAGVQFAPAGSARRRPAIVLAAPGDSVFRLRQSRGGAARVRARGHDHGRARLPANRSTIWCRCPTPGAGARSVSSSSPRRTFVWHCARWPRARRSTPRAISSAAPAPAQPIAVRAATLDRRVSALVLVSPELAPVERGPTRARIAELAAAGVLPGRARRPAALGGDRGAVPRRRRAQVPDRGLEAVRSRSTAVPQRSGGRRPPHALGEGVDAGFRAADASTIVTEARMRVAPHHQRAPNRSAPTVTANPSANTGSRANSSPIRPGGSVRCATICSVGAIRLRRARGSPAASSRTALAPGPARGRGPRTARAAAATTSAWIPASAIGSETRREARGQHHLEAVGERAEQRPPLAWAQSEIGARSHQRASEARHDQAGGEQR